MDNIPKKISGIKKVSLSMAIGVIVLVLAAWVIYAYSHRLPAVIQPALQDNFNIPQTATPTASSTPTSTPISTTAPGKKLSYGDAIKAYPERFQFSKCQGSPATMAVKKDTPVMLDNRDSYAHTIKAAAQTFKLPGYGYVIFYPKVLGNIAVTCDGVNRVMLNVQK